jgi:hypothetical protein
VGFKTSIGGFPDIAPSKNTLKTQQTRFTTCGTRAVGCTNHIHWGRGKKKGGNVVIRGGGGGKRFDTRDFGTFDAANLCSSCSGSYDV